MDHVFVLYIKRHCHIQSYLGFLLCVSFSFITLPCTFGSVICFQLIFVTVVSSLSGFIYLFILHVRGPLF